jgi:NAD+ synthase
MTDQLKIVLAQLNPTVGDIAGNMAKAQEARSSAKEQGADLVFFPELFLIGYPPEDLVLKPSFQGAVDEALAELARETGDGGPGYLIGAPSRDGDGLHNSMVLIDGGEIVGRRHKVHLPNYGVFDEPRVFGAGDMQGPLPFRGVRLGVPVCEDIWFTDVAECLVETGAELLLVPNGSPFDVTKFEARMQHCVARINETGLPLVYLNQMSGQDELVFDGASFVLNADLSLAHQLPAWKEATVVTYWERKSDGWRCETGETANIPTGNEAIYSACVLGLRDYVTKNRFPGVVLGLSGGVDSAICAAMAVDALGADKVYCVMLPYRYTAAESVSDAEQCAAALGVKYDSLPIEEPVKGFLSVLDPLFEGTESDTTEENLQSRTRGTLLMALSNKFGYMVVTTGNKSEVSVGYATLYGDMNGGYNPIKDLYKMQVFELCRWRNENKPEIALGPDGEVIPTNIITKPPSAELREDQKDEDSLPPYEVLDDILECLVEKELPVSEIINRGHDRDLVKRIEHLLYIAEYKRRQAAPGVKITARNFGRDRRYPITNGYRDKR